MNVKSAKELSRAELLALLHSFVNSRPGFDWHNYGDAASYRADMRTATRQRADALEMLAAIGWRESITADDIRDALQSGGRLRLQDDGRLNYCTGQYYCTEYRAGACRVLSSILWDYWREGRSTGDDIRKSARNNLSRGVVARWFR